MQGFFDKLGKTASNVANTAASKAGEFVEVNKLKNRQNELRTDMSATKRKIGDYIYKKFEDGELTDEKLLNYCKKIQDLREEFDDLDRQILETKEAHQAKRDSGGEERL